MHKGIDVSRWQGEIDFNKVKAAGYDFVIIKAGGSDMGFYTDSCWKKIYKAAKAAGLHVGAYYFVGFLFYGDTAGRADALRFIRMLDGKQMELPVFVDIETTQPARKAEATQAAIAFCETMEEAGYFVGIYASDIYGFKDLYYKTNNKYYKKMNNKENILKNIKIKVKVNIEIIEQNSK